MNVRRGWESFFEKALARFINILTRRIVFVCELTTSVYGPATTVSRVFCCAHIQSKAFGLNDFGVIPWTEYA
jgi:hypothetical protein